MAYHSYLILSLILMLPAFGIVIFSGFFGSLWLFAVALIFGVIDHFSHFDEKLLLVLAAFVPLAFLVDFFSGVIGAKLGGASLKSMFLGFVGAVLGTFLIPVPLVGTLIGLFFGILLGETLGHKNKRRAMKAAAYAVLGTVTGSLLNALISIAFILVFAIYAW